MYSDFFLKDHKKRATHFVLPLLSPLLTITGWVSDMHLQALMNSPIEIQNEQSQP